MRLQAPEWLKHVAETRPDFASYLYYMMIRLEACHKVLKDTGSIYLHCDWRASHYLKMIMDEVFGYANYQNDIIWHYGLGGSSPERWQRKFDNILFYSKSNKYIFNPEMIPATSQRMKGLLKKADNVWDIPTLNNMAKERVGYPTQKPLDLLIRIIKASSNEGDIVLDPFCGCGTAIIAAQQLGRHWVGIDISKDAYNVSKNRYHQLSFESQFGQPEPQYIERNLPDVEAIDKPNDFEKWVNEYFKATKPMPDRGVDGIRQDGIPIQTKTFIVTSKWLRNLLADAILHKQVKQPCKHAILVSQKGFDDTARQQQFEIQTKEGIKVDLLTPSMMLK
jgi:DNA modification methylase